MAFISDPDLIPPATPNTVELANILLLLNPSHHTDDDLDFHMSVDHSQASAVQQESDGTSQSLSKRTRTSVSRG